MVPEQRFAKDSARVRQARVVYQRLVNPAMEREHYDRFIVFDEQTDDFEIGDDPVEIALALRARHPDCRPFGFRIGDGGRAIDRFGSPRSASGQ